MHVNTLHTRTSDNVVRQLYFNKNKLLKTLMYSRVVRAEAPGWGGGTHGGRLREACTQDKWRLLVCGVSSGEVRGAAGKDLSGTGVSLPPLCIQCLFLNQGTLTSSQQSASRFFLRGAAQRCLLPTVLSLVKERTWVLPSTLINQLRKDGVSESPVPCAQGQGLDYGKAESQGLQGREVPNHSTPALTRQTKRGEPMAETWKTISATHLCRKHNPAREGRPGRSSLVSQTSGAPFSRGQSRDVKYAPRASREADLGPHTRSDSLDTTTHWALSGAALGGPAYHSLNTYDRGVSIPVS